jgi:hypothetical protein
MKIPMSAFLAITSGVGGKAAVNRDGRLRRELTHSGHRVLPRRQPAVNTTARGFR